MTSESFTPLEGGCTCRLLRYRLLAEPLITHCCHCTWCQRETGTAFAVNAWIEASLVEMLPPDPTKSPSSTSIKSPPPTTSSSPPTNTKKASENPTLPKPLQIPTPSLSGKSQTIFRCPNCYVAIWSNYGGAGPKFNFVRVGTLDRPEMCQPDIHIFTASQAKFVTLPKDGEVVNGKVVRVVDEYYKRSEVWKPEMVKRWEDARKVDKNVEEVVGGLGRVKI